MQTGVIFPQNEIGNDPVVIRDYAQTAEGLGFSHIGIYDHVLGASTEHRPGWRGYSEKNAFHEVMVLFGYLAAVTERIELVTDVLVLPQRQTALVAKQATEIDLLSNGRLRLGIGVGWNPVEYEALNENFHNRGKRIEEQVAVLRALWGQPVITFNGQWHHITEAGLNPLPKRLIPIWMGGSPEVVIPRVARIGDGWFPQLKPDEAMRANIQQLRQLTAAAGRDPSSVGVEGRIAIAGKQPDAWVQEAKAWRDLEATYVAFNTMTAGLAKPGDHIEALRQIKAAVG